MKSATIRPTPQYVVDAILVLAKWAREIDAAEIVVSPTGGAAFHLERVADRLLAGWEEERKGKEALLSACEATLDYWRETGFADCDEGCTCIVDRMRAAIQKAKS
jgi:hypothetical protein